MKFENEHAKTPLHESDIIEHEESQISILETTYLYIKLDSELSRYELANFWQLAMIIQMPRNVPKWHKIWSVYFSSFRY